MIFILRCGPQHVSLLPLPNVQRVNSAVKNNIRDCFGVESSTSETIKYKQERPV